jgi:GNAT superfamily N-acetyltransferase
LLDTLRSTARELGWSNALLYWLCRVLQLASNNRVRLIRYVLVAQPVPSEDLTPARRGRAIEVIELGAADVSALDFGRPRAVIEDRLRIGARCVAARKDDKLIGFQWFTLTDYPEDEVRCVFELCPGDACAWDFDVYVHPDARGQPVFPRLWDACNVRLREQGVTLSLSRINAFNSASLRAHSRLGARRFASATFLTMGAWQFALLPARPWVHASRRERPRVPVSRLARQSQKSA